MEKVILDTSVIVKWFIAEENSDQALRILQEIKNQKLKLIAPKIIILEVVNALFLGNNYPQEGILKALQDIEGLNPEWVNIGSLSNEVIVITTIQTKIAAYDAFFLALAETRKIPLITADKKHHPKKFSKYIQYL